jgi:hypothetical protein
MFCSKCGKESKTDAKFCINCGNKVETSEPVSEPLIEFPSIETTTHQQISPTNPTPNRPVPEPVPERIPEPIPVPPPKLSEDIAQYLTTNESVLVEFGVHTRKGGKYFATNKRLIHLKKKFFGMEFSDLIYKNINSIKQNTSTVTILTIPGFLISIFGLAIGEPISIGFGVISLFLGLFYFKNVKYRFIAPGLDVNELSLWNIDIPFWQTSSKEQANAFIKIVREKIADS